MKVLLIKDVYKLGRAGEIKKVADGYGRNYLIPQGLALPATESSVKLAEANHNPLKTGDAKTRGAAPVAVESSPSFVP